MSFYRRLSFMLTPPAILLVGHFYLAQRLAWALPNVYWQTLCLTFIIFMYVGITLGFLIRHDRSTPVNDVILWLAFSFLGLFSWLFVLSLLRDLLLFVFWGLHRWFHLSFATEGEIKMFTAIGVVFISLVALLVGYFNARRTPPIVQINIPIVHLPSELENFTIAQITDLHIGPTIKRPFVEKVVQATNALNADVIALTGDLIDGDVLGLREHTQPLTNLKAPLGVFAVTGNHEYYSGATQWVEEYRQLGLQVLQNEHVVLTVNQQQIVLGGVTDYDAGRFNASEASDPAQAIKNSPPNVAVKILLAHQPRSMWAAEKAGFNVQLSGHTHGGQFWPWGYFVRLQQPVVAGLHKHKNLFVYTSRGTGYWGPPMRIWANSEITLIRLKSA